jgi:hypothetical protein
MRVMGLLSIDLGFLGNTNTILILEGKGVV